MNNIIFYPWKARYSQTISRMSTMEHPPTLTLDDIYAACKLTIAAHESVVEQRVVKLGSKERVSDGTLN